jgi:predicted hydrolase (HD superfamily)
MGGNLMNNAITRNEAIDLLKKYNKEPFHILHALTVEGVMRWYAEQLGFESEADYWAMVGLLHDIDFEMWPEEHCIKAPELLKEINASEEMIYSICSHGYGICVDIKPNHVMEKVLFATDELTGLIGAAARMRPSKSVMDMELSSLKKKYKDKKFAAGCSRDIIQKGAELLEWNLDELLEKTIFAMRSCEESVNNSMKEFQ